MDNYQEPVLEWSALPADPTDVFNLLSWRVRLAPLIGQDAELARLLTWARHGDASSRIRFLTGPGGAGKSRLAAEAASTLRSQTGEPWAAGFLRRESPMGIPDGRALLVVDYPEERRQFSKDLMKDIAEEPGSMRLLFLSRQPYDSWRGDIEAMHVSHLTSYQDIAAPSLSDDDALALYRAVIERLRNHYSLKPGLHFDSDFHRWIARNRALNALPLFVVAAAIYAALNPTEALGYSGEHVVRALVSRELERMTGASVGAGFPRPEAVSRLAMFAVVRGGFDGAALKRFADPALELGVPGPETIVDAVSELPWWSTDHWPAPSPDIVAAALLFEVLKKRAERASDWLWSAIDDIGKDAIDRLGRIAYDIRTIYGVDAHRFTDWLVGIVANVPARAPKLRFITEEDRLPAGILPLSIAVGQALRTMPNADRELARLLHNLAMDLSDFGDASAALDASEEATEICRRLAEESPQEYEPSLALALTNLSGHRNELRQHAKALEAAQEAVAIRRRLADADPQKHAVNLARSLNNLSNRLSEIDKREQAFDAIKESVDILRKLVEKEPARYESELATSLNNLSNRLSEIGRASEAVDAVRDAVQIRRRLVAVLPARYEEDLAAGLHNYSEHLSTVGEFEPALSAMRDALTIYRRLAEERPARLRSPLGLTLLGLASRLKENGKLDEARTVAAEAISLYRELASEDPERFTTDLTNALALQKSLSAGESTP